jgi:hypothetical protein
MSEQAFTLINITIKTVRQMLQEPSLNPSQQEFLEVIGNEAYAMRDMLRALPQANLKDWQYVLDFESRSHLNVIIGFCGALLDEADGALSDTLRQQIEDLMNYNFELLSHLTEMHA